MPQGVITAAPSQPICFNFTERQCLVQLLQIHTLELDRETHSQAGSRDRDRRARLLGHLRVVAGRRVVPPPVVPLEPLASAVRRQRLEPLRGDLVRLPLHGGHRHRTG